MARRPSPNSEPNPPGGNSPPPGPSPQSGYPPRPGPSPQGAYPPPPPGPSPQGAYPPPPGPGPSPQGAYPQQGYGPPPGYGQQQNYPPQAFAPPKKRGGLATAALVLGIIGFVLAVIPFVNFAAYPIVILAIIFGLLAFRWGKGKAGVILGVLGLVATIVWTAAIAGAFDDAVNKQHTVLYQVAGTAQITKADVSYFSSDGSSKSSNISADGQALPFSKTVTVKGDLSGFVLTANLPFTTDSTLSGTLTCTLSVDGKVVSTDKSSGSFSLVTCSGTGYDGN